MFQPRMSPVVRLIGELGQRIQNVILNRLCGVVLCSYPAPLVQRPSTSAFQAGDHGFESRTGYQSSVVGIRFIAHVRVP